MSQSTAYKYIEKIDRVGDIVGGDQAADLLKIRVSDQSINPGVRMVGDDVGIAKEATLANIAAALASDGTDTLQVEQQSPVDLEADDGSGTIGPVWRRGNDLRTSIENDQVGFAKETTLASRLARDLELEDAAASGAYANVHRRGSALQTSIEADAVGLATEASLTSRLGREIEADDGAGTFGPIHRSGNALLVSHDGVIDVSSRDARNLGDVDVLALPDDDEAFENGTAMASGGTTKNSLSAPGADTLRGRVVRTTTSYDVTVDWEDGAGNTIFSDDIALGVTAGTETALNETAISPHCTVTVADAGSGSGAVTATLHLR